MRGHHLTLLECLDKKKEKKKRKEKRGKHSATERRGFKKEGMRSSQQTLSTLAGGLDVTPPRVMTAREAREKVLLAVSSEAGRSVRKV